MQGRSLWPMLTGVAPLDRHRDDVYAECDDDAPLNRHPPANVTMLRTAGHTLVVAHGAPAGTVGGELYDLSADPDETRNLWSDPSSAAVKLDLMARLCDRMAGTVDPLPPRTAAW